MACCASPSAIICWKTRRCCSRKKSSGLSFSMATFSTWLSSRMAPSTLRSASRLCGKGRSRATWVDMRSLRFSFADYRAAPRASARPFSLARSRRLQAQAEAEILRKWRHGVNRIGPKMLWMGEHGCANCGKLPPLEILWRTAGCSRIKSRPWSTGTAKEFMLAGPQKLAFSLHHDLDRGGDVVVELCGHLVFPDQLDGLAELDLAFVHLVALRGERLGDVRRGDGAEQLIVFAGLARQRDTGRGEHLGLLLRALPLGGGALVQHGANFLQPLQIAGRGGDGELPRQQEIARIARGHFDYLAAGAQLFDVFLQDDLHRLSLGLKVGGKRQQGDVAGALDGFTQPALVLRAGAGHAPRQDLAAVLHERLQHLHLLVIDEVHPLDAEAPHLFLHKILSLSLARPTGRPFAARARRSG